MSIPIYQVDTFTSELFRGNPAAVCLVNLWPNVEVMAAIAAENNLSETAFIRITDTDPQIRWFTPTQEVNLCGHATLAAGMIWLTHQKPDQASVTFQSPSGPLRVIRDAGRWQVCLPLEAFSAISAIASIEQALGCSILALFAGRDYLAVLDNEERVRTVKPDMAKLLALDLRGVCVTARGSECDFVSRFFAPKYGINEDPVTGSAHCMLMPYWAQKLGKTNLSARQLSSRGGELSGRIEGDRVWLAGGVVEYLEGRIRLPD